MKFAGAAVAAVVIVIALLLVVGIPSGFLTSTIASRVESATGYRLSIDGTTRISLWPTLNVTLNDLTLQDPKDRSGITRLTVDSVQADMSLSSVWSGRPKISELIVTRPVLYQPLLRERLPNAGTSSKPLALDTDGATIDRVKVTDGEVAFARVRDRVESRISAINADAVVGRDRNVSITGTARVGEHPTKFDIKATTPAPPTDRPTIPVEFAIDMPDVLKSRLAGHAEMRLSGDLVMINGVNGTLGDGAFNGWASVDIASKPLVKVDLDFQRLTIPLAKSPDGASGQPWSNAPIDVSGLNYVDAQIRISANDAVIGDARLAPLALDAKLAGGVLKAGTANLGAYGGQVSGEVILDATSGAPSFAMHSDLVGVRALPLLRGLAEFDRIDGKLQAKLALRSAGTSQRALMANMQGTAFVNFQDGAIRGINVAQMIRSLTSGTLSGWQDNQNSSQDQSTDLSQLSASFRIDKGQAVTTDLNLIGPLVRVTGAGTIALDTKMLGFRVEPKLVMTTEGQGRASEPVGFGIPVMIQGSWSQPRIYPDMAGMLDNPDAAYAKLREMGKGLFGPDGAGLGNILGSLGLGGTTAPGGGNAGSNANPQTQQPGQNNLLGGPLGEALGNLIQQGLSSGAATGTGTGRSRSLPATPSTPAPQASPAPAPPARAPDEPPVAQQDSQPMNDVLRQLFNNR
ncbi:AsmA family protein [Bradyrhizobium diazoefficiens]|uniref:Cell envelope biogenesis protein AsmA n=1 Tax=Bradyrhizobium diazoefficiens TaxID=1355477 RepID=A0A809XHL2_9BRAD|nr:cell envelope biogenesis protein AsmA [Bradyrhizobium diazoefficiens]BCA08508.1 cell envelope biogenesis protein AsmA [Bradyrhizobium diazoefficiens]BCE26589.1 cell envelope biogenesis protein AsmA [Bradyrhizobium diazoefficiens]BCE70310.1 cell envelope biogenesis protein AsmA [Bradyrhizobium diazoefficiens]BCE87558.1 cell envelope biogenesis protein AsmA [Bradyrhizobium diazoefficiens]